MFRAATCQEDLQHIRAIEHTNVQETSSSQLSEILYKSVTRPVQGKFHGILEVPKYGILERTHNSVVRQLNISLILQCLTLYPINPFYEFRQAAIRWSDLA